MPWRVPDLYAKVAEEEGRVVEVSDAAITVKYKSGETTSVELGTRYGAWSGKTIPHEVITTLKVGNKVEKGDTIAYNPLFFKEDTFSGNLAYKMGVLGRIGLVENEFTYEDSCEIYQGLADKLTTRNVEHRYITVDFDQEVHDLIKVGTDVGYDTTLCTLANSIDGVSNLFSESSLEALREVNSLTPRSHFTGKVTGIECVYVGEFDDMTETLQTIAGASDRRLFKKAKDLGRPKVSGQLTLADRYGGKMLDRNTAIIRVSIDVEQKMGTGSKVVFGHQMKSINSNTHNFEVTTEDGQPYDGLFSYTSNIKRVVESCLVLGVCNTYSIETGKGFVDIVRGRNK